MPALPEEDPYLATVPRHIGIIGCSSEGAALCYRTICSEGAALGRPYAHPSVSMHTHSLADYVDALEQGDLARVEHLMLDSADRLLRAGADFLICPDNTIHQSLGCSGRSWQAPLLHIAEVVADEAAQRGYRRLGLLGTRWLVDSAVYPERLSARGLEAVRPDAGLRLEVDRIIMDELVQGRVRPHAVDRLREVARAMQAQGCDAVILGCTELPLVLDDRSAGLPTLDSTRLLARAALRRAHRLERP